MININDGAHSNYRHCGDAGSYQKSLGSIIARRAVPVVAASLICGGAAQGAVLTVNDKSDPGGAGDSICSLREAITSINNGVADPDCPNSSANPLGTSDTINFAASLNNETIDLDGNALVIEADVGILGPDPGEPKGIVIDAGGLSRVVEVADGDEIILNSMTLAEGATSGSGGAVLVDTPPGAELTLLNCQVSQSTADDLGGGIHAGYADAVVINQSMITGNTAGIRGGGVSTSSGTVTVINSEIVGNRSDGDAGAVYVLGPSAPSSLIIISSSIADNEVPSGSTGGIFVSGAMASANISNSVIRDNDGRGIFTALADLDLLRSGVAGHMGFVGSGGGISISGDATITESTISGNSTVGNGGGIFSGSGSLTLINSSIAGNSAGNNGGGVLISGTSTGAQITRSTVSGNTAGNSAGGISIGENTEVAYSTVSGNSAGTRGGGLIVLPGHTLDLAFSTVAANTAGVSGSNLHTYSGGTSDIAGSLIVNGQGADNCSGEPLNVTLTSLTNDDAGCGGGLTQNPLAGSRLGVLTENDGPTDTHALFEGNPAIDAGGTVCDSTDQRTQTKPVDGDGNGTAECDIGAVEFIDSDFDGIIDFYEQEHGLDPDDPNDPNGGEHDADGDGVSNQDEFEADLDADDADTDNDILGDGIDADPTTASNACIQDGLGDAEFNITAMAGMVTQCAAQNSVTVRGTAIIEGGAVLELYSPNIAFDPQVGVPIGAQVEGNAVDPVPDASP